MSMNTSQDISVEEREFQKEALDVLDAVKAEQPRTLADNPVRLEHNLRTIIGGNPAGVDIWIEADMPEQRQIEDKWWQTVEKLEEMGAFTIEQKDDFGCLVNVHDEKFNELHEQCRQAARLLKSARQRAEETLPRWDLPTGTKWEDITLRFLDGEEVQISIHDKTRHTTCEEMGFINNKTKRPNAQWQLLRDLSKNNGEIHWDNVHNLSPKIQNSLKTQIKLLRKGLRAYFPTLEDDPFYNYRKEKAYRIKVHLIPEQGEDQDSISDDEEYLKDKNPSIYDPFENRRE